MAAPIITTGASITFDSGFFAQILGIQRTGRSRAAIETTHYGTTGSRTYEPGSLIEEGELVVEIKFDPVEVPPLASAAETGTITWTGGTTWANSVFMTNMDVTSGDVEEHVTATCTLKATGALTIV